MEVFRVSHLEGVPIQLQICNEPTTTKFLGLPNTQNESWNLNNSLLVQSLPMQIQTPPIEAAMGLVLYAVCTQRRRRHLSDEEVPEPVGHGGQPHTLAAVLQREDFRAVDPDLRFWRETRTFGLKNERNNGKQVYQTMRSGLESTQFKKAWKTWKLDSKARERKKQHPSSPQIKPPIHIVHPV